MAEQSLDRFPSNRTELGDQVSALERSRHRPKLLDVRDEEPLVSERAEKKLSRGFWISVGWLGFIVVVSLLAPQLRSIGILADPNEQDLTNTSLPLFSAGHLLGTDNLGRDILSRSIFGARVSIAVGVASVAFGLLFGSIVGLTAGYFRGRLETVLMAIVDVMLAFPALLLALAIVTFTKSQELHIIILAIGVVAIPPLARLVRANTLAFAQREFVLAARALGASDLRIILREILPNVALPAISFSIIGVAVAIVAEGALAFLGLSIPPPDPTWGKMIAEGRGQLDTGAPWIPLVPGFFMFLTVLALNFAGDSLREFFDVKESGL
ncbi:MAG: peptide ABC transporter permease [Acidimicrobiales bacterium]|nr:MAG: peptide ABC transporter permease [Acidimicrobiales bacterium]